MNADLPGTAGFDAASQFVREEDVESALPCGDDGAAVIEAAKEYADAGHSFLNRHGLGPLQVLERVAGFGYHEPSAEDAWGRILRTFDRALRR